MLRTLFLTAFLFFHPVHVTLTSLDYSSGSGVFRVFIKMYYDDFLSDCRLSGLDEKNIDFSSNDSTSISVMEKYLAEKVKVEVNDRLLGGKVQNMNMTDNEISISLEYGKVKKPRTVSVTNQIMTSLYSDQANMLIVRVNKFEEGVKLTPGLTEKTFMIK